MDLKHYLIFGGLSFAIHSLAFSANYKPIVVSPIADNAGKAVSIQFVSAQKPSEKATPPADQPSTTQPSTTQDVKASVTQTKPITQKVKSNPVVEKQPPLAKQPETKKTAVKKPEAKILPSKKSLPKKQDVQKIVAKKPVEHAPIPDTTAPIEKISQTDKLAQESKVKQSAPVARNQSTNAANSAPKLVTKPTFETRPSAINYPRSAKRRNIQGNVLVEVWLDEHGEQTNLVIVNSSGHQILDSAALKGISEWQFRQHQTQGQAIAHRVQIPINFKLD